MIIITRLVNKFKKSIDTYGSDRPIDRDIYRRVFDDFLEKNMQSSTVFAVIVLDIDKLKNINDTHGHIFGDEVIKQVAQRINENLKKPDLVSRWGGDEFGCIAFGKHEVIIEKIESIQDSISKDELLKDYTVTVSMGIAYYKIVILGCP